MREDHRQILRPVASWNCEDLNLSGESKVGVSEYGIEEKKDPYEAEGRQKKQLRYVNIYLKSIDRLLCAFSKNS
jgi:hypothetical protein